MLNANEKIVTTIKPSFAKLFLSSKLTNIGILSLIAIIAAIILIKLPLILILIPIAIMIASIIPNYIKYYLTTYIITTEKILVETGLTRDYDVVKLEKIFDTNIDTNLLDTLLGTGNIKLSTSNVGEPVFIYSIKNPKKILGLIKF